VLAVVTRGGRRVVLLAVLALAGCAAPPQTARLLQEPPRDLPPAVELVRVPFFPQEDYQCGPAALATVLGASGLDIDPAALVPQVYLPGRRGSLQVELVAAARRHGRLAYTLAPRLEDLLREVAAGHPVLVLQNLGTDWYPVWHFAVVAGYDLARGEVVLRSGRRPRHRVTLGLFERTWARGGHFALLVLPPGELGPTFTPDRYARAAAALEQAGRLEAARAAYAAGAARWPGSAILGMGLGNVLYALGRRQDAAAAFRAVLDRRPGYAPAHNNLAQVLLELGELAAARRHARRAVALGGPHQAVYRETLAEVEAALARRDGG